MTSNESILKFDLKNNQFEDDGNLVILDCNLGTSHLVKKDKCWIPLLDIMHLELSRDRNWLIHHGLAIFLDLCLNDGTESKERLMFKRIEELFFEFLRNQAKESYRNQLVRVRDGEPMIIMDASVSAPDPELLNEEFDTLKHFHQYLPEKVERYMSLWGWYDAIDWEVFGSKITFLMDVFDVDELTGDLLPDQSSHTL